MQAVDIKPTPSNLPGKNFRSCTKGRKKSVKDSRRCKAGCQVAVHHRSLGQRVVGKKAHVNVIQRHRTGLTAKKKVGDVHMCIYILPVFTHHSLGVRRHFHSHIRVGKSQSAEIHIPAVDIGGPVITASGQSARGSKFEVEIGINR